MLTKKLLLPTAALIASAGLFSASQAYAFDNDDAAVLVGVAVGGLTAYAISHANDHYRDYRPQYEYREYRPAPPRYCPPRRVVEHVVIQRPPQYRHWDWDHDRVRYDRVRYDGDDHRWYGDHDRGHDGDHRRYRGGF